MTDELPELIRFVREHWDEPPTKMHSGGVEPDSEIGAPRWDERWRTWMGGVGDYRAATTKNGREESIRRCDHRDETELCLDCGGSGRILLARGQYKWPMRAALAKVAGRSVPEGWPPLDVVVRTLANCQWSIEATMLLMSEKYPLMGHPTFALGVIRRALKNCRQEYATTTRWKRVAESEKPDSQRSAEAA